MTIDLLIYFQLEARPKHGDSTKLAKPENQVKSNEKNCSQIYSKAKQDSMDFYVKEMDQLFAENFKLESEELDVHHRKNHRIACAILKSSTIPNSSKAFNKFRTELNTFIERRYSSYVKVNKTRKSYNNRMKQLCENASHLSASDFEAKELEIRRQCLESVSKK